MKAFFQIAIWVWWTVMIVPALVCQSAIEETKALSYSRVTFNFEGATTKTYSDFMTSLRNQLKSGSVQGLPVTRKTVKDTERYLLAELKINNQNSVTLAIDVTDLYVVAYLDKYQGKDRVNFLRDAPKVARDNLVDKGATVRNIGFGGSYRELEGAATGRQNIELGVTKLQYAVQSVSGKAPASLTKQIEGKFFIISIQMISEAARFEYILKKVLEKGIDGSYKPDPKTLNLENNWGKISEAIHKSSSAGIISPALQLIDANNKPWTINNVKEIAPDIGLLKFKG
ncbi:unnamed protein product [Dovyalis caffra]|uniref:rRNA N-glycosylase n=1 Tax=Dovyalis caffra TaxID=77055 RepID=A0AAV1RTM9_9ROSI|nr:unnamed protein product [Dovyalis caffra]